jgi:hypothetical protein
MRHGRRGDDERCHVSNVVVVVVVVSRAVVAVVKVESQPPALNDVSVLTQRCFDSLRR